MAASEWTVLVFGDSWVDYMHPCWPHVLARKLGARAIQFGQAGSTAASLNGQVQKCVLSPQTPKGSGGKIDAKTLVVVHTCGNDLIGKLMPLVMGGGTDVGSLEMMQPNPGKNEGEKLKRFLETMYSAGARNFLVSGVPLFYHMPIFNFAWPIVQGLVNQGRLEQLGVSPGDPPHLAIEVQAAALHERWCDLCDEFSKAHSDASCVFFDEVDSLHTVRERLGDQNFDRQMWDMSMFHPTAFGHEQIASEAHRCVTESFPAITGIKTQLVAPPAEKVQKVEEKVPKLKLRIRNVKGDVTFEVASDPRWTVGGLRKGVLDAAPKGFAQPEQACILCLQGKFLEDGPKTLSEMGLAEGTQLIAVMKAVAAAKPAGPPTGGYAAN